MRVSPSGALEFLFALPHCSGEMFFFFRRDYYVKSWDFSLNSIMVESGL